MTRSVLQFIENRLARLPLIILKMAPWVSYVKQFICVIFCGSQFTFAEVVPSKWQLQFDDSHCMYPIVVFIYYCHA